MFSVSDGTVQSVLVVLTVPCLLYRLVQAGYVTYITYGPSGMTSRPGYYNQSRPKTNPK
jgi:hypothetical protein